MIKTVTNIAINKQKKVNMSKSSSSSSSVWSSVFVSSDGTGTISALVSSSTFAYYIVEVDYYAVLVGYSTSR
jgi:hypothetical protein